MARLTRIAPCLWFDGQAEAAAQQCGWLKDRFGLSWQVVPSMLPELLLRGDAKRSERMMQARMPMLKLDIDALQRAWRG